MSRLPFRDWIVTACFYAAVHIAEGLFHVLSPLGKKHSENTMPAWFKGSTHGWRKKLINELVNSGNLSREFLNIYKNLHTQSTISRYLVYPSRGGSSVSINTLSSNHFSLNDIKSFIKTDLAKLEDEAKHYISTITMPHSRISLLISKLKDFFKN